MIFKNGLDKCYTNDEVLGKWVDKSMYRTKGDIAFLKILSDAIKGKEINTRDEFYAYVAELFNRLTGKSIESADDQQGHGLRYGYSEELRETEPWENASVGYITCDIWTGDEPTALDFIAEKYNLK